MTALNQTMLDQIATITTLLISALPSVAMIALLF